VALSNRSDRLNADIVSTASMAMQIYPQARLSLPRALFVLCTALKLIFLMSDIATPDYASGEKCWLIL
jgi:hypothetical protein